MAVGRWPAPHGPDHVGGGRGAHRPRRDDPYRAAADRRRHDARPALRPDPLEPGLLPPRPGPVNPAQLSGAVEPRITTRHGSASSPLLGAPSSAANTARAAARPTSSRFMSTLVSGG